MPYSFRPFLVLALSAALASSALAKPKRSAPTASPSPTASDGTSEVGADHQATIQAPTPKAVSDSANKNLSNEKVRGGTVKQEKEGEFVAESTGTRKQQLTIGKLDPPAAFNLEDIQNFPEERLTPVLNNPIVFEEGHDYSTLMGSQNNQLYHPWLAELQKSPFLRMKSPPTEKTREWQFAIIDQAGATVAKQEGKGAPPDMLTWTGDDNKRDHLAVETVYIPQLSTVDKDGYHHTFSGQPVQLSALAFQENNHTVIEVSSKRLFLENKSEFTKEADTLLEKISDTMREENRLPITIQPYDEDQGLAAARQQVLLKYFAEKLVIPEDQIVAANPAGPAGFEKRGPAFAIFSSGGAQ